MPQTRTTRISLKTIVLAYTEEVTVLIRERRTDLGERPDTRTELQAKAAVWLLAGGADDLRKAKAHAASLGWQVFTYPTDEPDQLGRARKDVLKQAQRALMAARPVTRRRSVRAVT